MKRLLLSLICCSPLLFSPSASFSLDITGPSDEALLSFDQYGPVSPVETLWAISVTLRPDSSVSVQQTMLALYKSNPEAFFKGDLNKMIPGSILTIPSFTFIQQQTNREAILLIEKYSKKPKNVAPKPEVKKVVKVKDRTVVESAPLSIKPIEVEPKVIPLDNPHTAIAEENSDKLQAELQELTEQFIVATEATQALKLKLQPLNDQISMLTEQLDAEKLIQQQLQKIIDDYRAQLDAIEPAPFTGDGLLNKMLHLIASSMTNLLIVIISPIILLLLLYVVITRIRSKRELAQQEQELAESTAILMEEEGQFDTLLTEDFSDEAEQDIDLESTEVDAVTAENTELDEFIIPDDVETIDLSEDEELIASIDLDEGELETNEDDPFGIGALVDDEEPMATIDLDSDEPETSEDDPFGIGALVDDEEPMATIDLDSDESKSSEDDPFGIGALVDDELAEESPISEDEQANLDLASELESQVVAETETDLVKGNDVVEKSELDVDSAIASTETELDAVQEVAIDDDLASVEDVLDTESELESVEDVLADIDMKSELDTASDEVTDIDVETELESVEDVLTDIDTESELESAEDVLADIDTELELESVEDILADIDTKSELDTASDEVTDIDVETELKSVEDVLADIDTESELESAEDVLADIDTEPELESVEDVLADIDTEPELESVEDILADIDTKSELDTASDEVTDIDVETELESVEDVLADLDAESVTSETIEVDLESLSDEVVELDTETAADELSTSDNDLLAKQIGEVAFNEEVPLPQVGDITENDFIDIETLLENSDSIDKDEPYSELDLDLGLEEFPDVVDLQESVDIDDDENGISAQLDLARAYLEIDDKAGAKEILMSVVDQSNGKQRVEIDKLLSHLT